MRRPGPLPATRLRSRGGKGRLADGSTMARAYKVSSDHPSVDYLVRSHADLGGQIKSNLNEAKDLADAIRRG